MRRGAQSCVLLLVVLAAILAWPGGAPGRTSPFQGTPWAGSVFGVKLMDPLAGLESLLSGHAAVLTVALAVLLPVAATMLLGRVFCSWICPAGFLFEGGDAIRRRLAGWGLGSRGLRLWRETKYVILAVGLAFVLFGAGPVLGSHYPPALLGREVHGAVFAILGRETGPAGPVFTGGAAFLFLILIVESALSPRAWCRTLCPGGALYSLLGAKRALRVKRNRETCTDCAACVPTCPMGLNPMRDQIGLSCDNCLECVASCPEEALHVDLGFKNTRSREGGHAA